MSGKLISPGVAKVDHEHHMILFEGEKLKYTARKMGVLKKRKSGALALFLGLTRGPFIAVQPLCANGELVEPERKWSRATSWDFVGEIDRCVAWREPKKRRRKRDAVANLLLRLVGKPKRPLVPKRPDPVVEWTEHYEPWPKVDHTPATKWEEVVAKLGPAPAAPSSEEAKPAKKKR